MSDPIILASASTTRATLLRNAGVSFEVAAARVDEDALRASLKAEAASPRDIADGLAEMKALKVSSKHPDALVLGCDQVLSFERDCLTKPSYPADAVAQLRRLRGKPHELLSAAVIYQNGEPLWRQVGKARLHMRALSDEYIEDYVARNWDEIRYCVGCYQLEAEGARLFHRVEGDYFTVLGLPLLDILSYLTLRGTLPG